MSKGSVKTSNGKTRPMHLRGVLYKISPAIYPQQTRVTNTQNWSPSLTERRSLWCIQKPSSFRVERWVVSGWGLEQHQVFARFQNEPFVSLNTQPRTLDLTVYWNQGYLEIYTPPVLFLLVDLVMTTEESSPVWNLTNFPFQPQTCWLLDFAFYLLILQNWVKSC